MTDLLHNLIVPSKKRLLLFSLQVVAALFILIFPVSSLFAQMTNNPLANPLKQMMILLSSVIKNLQHYLA